MFHRLSSVVIRLRTGAVRTETAHLNYEVFIDNVLLGYYETKKDAEDFARAAIFDGEGV